MIGYKSHYCYKSRPTAKQLEKLIARIERTEVCPFYLMRRVVNLGRWLDKPWIGLLCRGWMRGTASKEELLSVLRGITL